MPVWAKIPKEREDMKMVPCIIVVLVAIMFTGCKSVPQSQGTGKPPATVGALVPYGQNVYYFNTVNLGGIGPALAKFLEEHQELEVSAMAGDGTGLNGMDRGYYVTFRPR